MLFLSSHSDILWPVCLAGHLEAPAAWRVAAWLWGMSGQSRHALPFPLKPGNLTIVSLELQPECLLPSSPLRDMLALACYDTCYQLQTLPFFPTKQIISLVVCVCVLGKPTIYG